MKRYIKSYSYEDWLQDQSKSSKDEDLDDFLIDFAYETCDLEEPYTKSEFAEFKQRCKELGYKVTKEDFKIYLDKVNDILG